MEFPGVKRVAKAEAVFMRKRGKITYWNDEKGYGFILPDSGSEKVFVHISDFGNRFERPDLDVAVTYLLSTDKQGRPRAVKVLRVGEKLKLPVKARNSNHHGYVLFALIFMSIVGISVLFADIPIQVLYVYLVVSIVTIIFYALDKSAARRGAWRTPENTLHALALIGGWPGAMIAQQTLRHKSSKRSFRVVFWLTVVLNCGVFGWLFLPSGGAAVRAHLYELGRLISSFGFG